MRKRIHLHQLRVGMFVEEIEGDGPGKDRQRNHFRIDSREDIERILGCAAMSAIINVRKGADVEGGSPVERERFEARLAQTYSAGEISRARATVANTAPEVKKLLKTAYAQNRVDMAAAGTVVDEIVKAAASNAGALIGLSRLRDKDEATFMHCLSVSVLMATFGGALRLDDGTVRLLAIGGLLHDIGKMAIPIGVLGKNGKLTEQEFAIIRSHPERGYHMLRQIDGTDQSVLDICRYHHEQFDGGGYPAGLAGETIPYAARIAAICDVYDALTTVRPYKKAWTQAEAVEKMLQSRGHFDPDLLKQFVSRMVVSGLIQ